MIQSETRWGTAKPIETIYRQYRFRSRLEARWAVFFDTLGLPFEYEPEGFDLGDGFAYLPDFWLPELSLWVEIKAGDPSTEELQKAERLSGATGCRVYMPFGGIPKVTTAWNGRTVVEYATESGFIWKGPEVVTSPCCYTATPDRHGDLFWGCCPDECCTDRHSTTESEWRRPCGCGAPTVERYIGWDNYHYWCECSRCGKIDVQFEGRGGRIGCGCTKTGDRGHSSETPRLVAAFNAASRARFEHAERWR